MLACQHLTNRSASNGGHRDGSHGQIYWQQLPPSYVSKRLVSYRYFNGSNHNPALVQFAKVEAAMLCPLLMPPVESSAQLGLLILPNTLKLASQAVSK
jgi:hypothetical protein